MRKLGWALLLGLLAGPGGAQGQLTGAQKQRLLGHHLKVILVPSYVPEGFHLVALDLKSPGEYLLKYAGPGQASFFLSGRNQGVADGGPDQTHLLLRKGPFQGNWLECSRAKAPCNFYTGYLRLAGDVGENAPSFDVEGTHMDPREAVRIVESLTRLRK